MNDIELRDKIAINAMTSLLEDAGDKNIGNLHHGSSIKIYRRISDSAYKMADAMMNAREKDHKITKRKSKKDNDKEALRIRRIESLRLRLIESKSYKDIGNKFDRAPETIRQYCALMLRKMKYKDYITYDIPFLRDLNIKSLENKDVKQFKKAIDLYKEHEFV